jgi:hypothetical protein
MSRGELDVLRRIIEAVPSEDGVALRGRADASLDHNAMANLGLSKREIIELAEKLQPAADRDFELDLSTMKSAEEMGAQMQAAVPKLELS